MKKTLGTLEKVELREVWERENSDFTPWLAGEENINILGQKIKSYNYNNQLPCNYKVTWNGSNDRNTSVSGVVYLVTLKTHTEADVKKIIFLK